MLHWGLGVKSFDASALGLAGDPSVTMAIPPDTAHLVTPTYDGSSQCTHPDILVEPDRVLLAVTPYPFSNGRIENPSLLTAPDGMAFEPFVGAPSPLVPAPPVDHNDDPDLRKLPGSDEYELLYLETERPMKQTIVALRSTDLMTWTRHDAIVYDLPAGDIFIVSPAAIVDPITSITHMFYVETGKPNHIGSLTSVDGTTWDKTADVAVPLELPPGIQPWHLDVLRAGTGYAMLISGFDEGFGDFSHQDLFLATSPDLVTWTAAPMPLLTHAEVDASTLYRSSGVMIGDRLVVWYAMQFIP